MTDVTTELAKLTASTTALTNTVVGKYAALDSKVADAGDSAANAATSEANAAQSVVDAQTVVDVASSELAAITAADRVATAESVTAAGAHVTSAQQAKAGAEAARVGAETAEANAAAVVTGGTATTLSEAGKIPLANSEGKIDNAWIAGAAKCTKHDFEARRAQNNETFAASGFVHFGSNYSGNNKVENAIGLGLNTIETEPNKLRLGRKVDTSSSLESKTGNPHLHIAGVKSVIDFLSTEYIAIGGEVRFPPAEDGTRTYDSSSGASVNHATPAIAFASETATNKVVTDRVDMWGFEAYLREVSDADPFVYAKGLIQSLAYNINGVTTVSDNVRPITYFAWYEGDKFSRGRGVNWQTASEANRIKIASDPANNIYFDDATGKFYQWCIRGRSFAGKGNGDWGNVETTDTNALSFDAKWARVLTQGMKDESASFGAVAGDIYANNPAWGSKSKKFYTGIFSARGIQNNNGIGVNGECYFLVCGTVNRLNQGAYHPSLNAMGARGFASTGSSYGAPWYSNLVVTQPTTAADCFNPSIYARPSGNIGHSGNSSFMRPNNRLYDAIYASGQGGVCRDMRYSAWGLTQEDFAEADLAVKSGGYRGRERLVRMRKAEVVDALPNNEAVNGLRWIDTLQAVLWSQLPSELKHRHWISQGSVNKSQSGGSPKYRDLGFVSTNEELQGSISSWSLNSSVYVYGGSSTLGEIVLVPCLSDWSVAGEYTHTEVIGDPANILQCDDLKDGWIGSWNPVIPDGATTWDTFQATRPVIDTVLRKVQTVNNGDTWIFGYHDFSPVNNAPSATSSPPISRVEVWNYKTKAKMTEDSVNSKVYGGMSGVGDVHFSDRHLSEDGSDLTFSLTGAIPTENTSPYTLIKAVENLRFDRRGIILQKDGVISHSEIVRPSYGGSKGVKALNYNVVENQQGFINYAYTELQYNGTDWGDDSKIHIADNQTTMLDTNGQSVKVGTARIVEPLGWIKNDK